MALRMINRNTVRFKELLNSIEKSRRQCLHSSFKYDKNIPFCLSDIGEGIREVTVKSWHVKVNDKVSQFDEICEVESDKATVKITSRYDGVIKKLYYNIDDIALVGKPLVDIDVADEENVGADKSSNMESNQGQSSSELSDSMTNEKSIKQSFQTQSDPVWDKSLATPAVRRIATEHKINLGDVKATGKNNRVLKEDILGHIGSLNKLEEPVDNTKCELKPISRIMKTMIKSMTETCSIPLFGYSDDFDFSRLIEIKLRLSKSNDIKITYLPFILKALSKALLKYPVLNSSLDKDLKNIIYKNYHNIGVAVASPSGLLVPNVKHVERLSIIEIHNELKRLQKAAYDGTLKPDDLNDGTFSVSNIGAIGGVQGMPLILPPEVAIVAVGKVRKLATFNEENQAVPVNLVSFTFTADHRILDGATVSRCSTLMKNYLENPELLLLDL